MEKTNKTILVISVVILCLLGWVVYNITSKTITNQEPVQQISDNYYSTKTDGVFSDGLKNPVSVINYQLGPEGIGIASKSVYMIDINGDTKPDRITKIFFENGNAHSYYEYKIELYKDGNFTDITPKNLKTTNGADCDLQQIQFTFKPKFKITMIYREMGINWNEPTVASRRVFFMSGDEIQISDVQKLRKICDVKELF